MKHINGGNTMKKSIILLSVLTLGFAANAQVYEPTPREYDFELSDIARRYDMHPKKVTVKKVTGVKLVTLFILILAVTQHIH